MRITDLINNKIAQEQQARKDRKRSGKFSPSGFGKCFRSQTWYNRQEEPSNPPDERTLRVFKAGDIFQDFIEGLIPASDGIKHEVMVATDLVLGFADTVMGNEVIEYKTQHSKSFWFMRNKGFKVSEEKRDHCLQVMFYAINLKKRFARLVYISKDDLCISEYKLQVTDFWIDIINKEIATLLEYRKSGELPPAKPRLYKQKDGSFKECEWCNYKDKCQAYIEVKK